MSEPLEDDAPLDATQRAFIEAYVRARKRFKELPSVLGVGFGRKQVRGSFTDELAIQVFVREKHPDEALSSAARIPPTFEGYRTDVRVAQAVETLIDEAEYMDGDDSFSPRIHGGIQIEPRKKDEPPTGPVKGVGTLGCIVRKSQRSGDDNLYLLSCKHVLFGEQNERTVGDYVYHPFASKTGTTLRGQLLGAIEDYGFKERVRFMHAGIPHSPYIDCAIARIDVGSTCCGKALSGDRVHFDPIIAGLGPVGEPHADWVTDVRSVFLDSSIMQPGVVHSGDSANTITNDAASLLALLNAAPDTARVRKVGRSTGLTVGIVTGVNVVAIKDPSAAVPQVWEDMIEILLDPKFKTVKIVAGNSLEFVGYNRCLRRSFAEHGDSGSLVVDHENKAIGLVVGRQLAQVAGNNYVVFACHIVPVLEQLGVYIPTFEKHGQGRGADGATDGTGEALYVPGVEPPENEDKTLFASAAVAESRTGRTGRTGRANEIRDAFQRTARGRELFAAFTLVQREIGYLVRNSRPVKVVWHRNQGPAFFAQTLSYFRGERERMPSEIKGVLRATLLARLRVALLSQGSHSLRVAIHAHGDAVLQFAEVETLSNVVEVLDSLETVEVLA